MHLKLLASLALGVIGRAVCFNRSLEERLEFSSGKTSYFKLVEQMEWPTQNALHTPHVLFLALISTGVVTPMFFIAMDLLVAGLLYFTLSYYYTSTREQTRHKEAAILSSWEDLGRPRLYSENGNVVVLTPEEDGKEEQWPACEKHEPIPSTYAENIALAYWLCPIPMLTCGARSFAPLSLALCLLALYFTQRSKVWFAGAAFALLTFLQGPALGFALVYPLYVMNKAPQFLLISATSTFALLCATVGFPIYDWDIRDLKPNVGMWWYLQTEVFDQFRSYFLLLLHVFPFLVSTMLHVFLHHRPVIHMFYSLAVWQTFQPFPELFHVFTSVLMLASHPEFLQGNYVLWPCLLVLGAVTLLLQPLMLYLWLDNGGGNANYYYFQCLISNGMLGIILLQFYMAVIVRDTVMQRIVRFAMAVREKKE